MGLFYHATFAFKPETRNAKGLVLKAAKAVGLDIQQNGESYCNELAGHRLLVEVSVQFPRYELMHAFTKSLIEHPSKLCTWASVSTHYDPENH